MSSFECSTCNKSYTFKANLKRHMKKDHTEKRVNPEIVNPEEIKIFNKREESWPLLNSYTYYKCGQVFTNELALDKHNGDVHANKKYKHECFVCLKPFYTKRELDMHVQSIHPPPAVSNASEMFPGMVAANEEICTPFIFEHPFSMIIVGPSRSGKTHWLIDLLVQKSSRIRPTPASIVYCYSHWQSKYNDLKMKIPYVQWIQGLPDKNFLDKISNAIVVIDDLMDASVNDQNMMSIFTERSHHQNLSVILTMQNLFHQGAKARSIQLNAQYMVLYKNPRDRQQIKTLAMQMYPEKWRRFLEQFEHETSKPYGKIIIDLRPNTKEENRIVKEKSGVLERMEQKQHQLLEYTNPYLAEAQDEQSRMSSILADPSLNEYQKQTQHAEALRNYQLYMSKANENNRQHLPPPLLPLIPPVTATTTVNTAITPARTPHQPIKPPDSGYMGTMDDILDIPYVPLATTSKDLSEDEGDENHMDNFISLSDDEETKARKEKVANWRFQQRVLRKRQQRRGPHPY